MLEEYTNLFKLTGKVALVSGGGGGIGQAVCTGLASMGAIIILTDMDEQKALQIADSIRNQGGEAKGYALNASNVTEVKTLIKNIIEDYKRIDILVNCVGTHRENRAEQYTENDWDMILSINLKAAFFLSQAVAEHQIQNGGGAHIHLTSVRSILGIQRGYSAYCASKGGLAMMIKQLATEWAKYKITVNGIAPTFTNTPLVTEYLNDPSFINPLLERIPLGRICDPKDIAGLAMFLSSPAGAFISGQNIALDGGLTATQ